MTTYTITDMRAVFTTGKMTEKHPDRLLTVYGTFFNESGTQLSITTKPVTFEEAKHPEFNIDLENGTLTISSGEKGRKKVESVSQDEINKRLNAIRK